MDQLITYLKKRETEILAHLRNYPAVDYDYNSGKLFTIQETIAELKALNLWSN